MVEYSKTIGGYSNHFHFHIIFYFRFYFIIFQFVLVLKVNKILKIIFDIGNYHFRFDPETHPEKKTGKIPARCRVQPRRLPPTHSGLYHWAQCPICTSAFFFIFIFKKTKFQKYMSNRKIFKNGSCLGDRVTVAHPVVDRT